MRPFLHFKHYHPEMLGFIGMLLYLRWKYCKLKEITYWFDSFNIVFMFVWSEVQWLSCGYTRICLILAKRPINVFISWCTDVYFACPSLYLEPHKCSDWSVEKSIMERKLRVDFYGFHLKAEETDTKMFQIQ